MRFQGTEVRQRSRVGRNLHREGLVPVGQARPARFRLHRGCPGLDCERTKQAGVTPLKFRGGTSGTDEGRRARTRLPRSVWSVRRATSTGTKHSTIALVGRHLRDVDNPLPRSFRYYFGGPSPRAGEKRRRTFGAWRTKKAEAASQPRGGRSTFGGLTLVGDTQRFPPVREPLRFSLPVEVFDRRVVSPANPADPGRSTAV